MSQVSPATTVAERVQPSDVAMATDATGGEKWCLLVLFTCTVTFVSCAIQMSVSAPALDAHYRRTSKEREEDRGEHCEGWVQSAVQDQSSNETRSVKSVRIQGRVRQ